MPTVQPDLQGEYHQSARSQFSHPAITSAPRLQRCEGSSLLKRTTTTTICPCDFAKRRRVVLLETHLLTHLSGPHEGLHFARARHRGDEQEGRLLGDRGVMPKAFLPTAYQQYPNSTLFGYIWLHRRRLSSYRSRSHQR